MIYTILLVTLAIGLLNPRPVRGAGSDKRPLLYATYSKLCTVADQLKRTPKRVSKFLTTVSEAAKVANVVALKLRIKSAKEKTREKRLQMEALAHLMEEHAVRTVSEIQAEGPTWIRAAVTTSTLRARIAEGLSVFKEAKVGTGHCLDGATANQDGHTAFETQNCIKDDLEAAADDAKFTSDELDGNGFKSGPDGSQPVSTSSSADTKCALTNTGATAGTHCFKTGAKFIAGLLTLNNGDTSSAMKDISKGLTTSPRQTTDTLTAALHDANLINQHPTEKYKTAQFEALKATITKAELK
uniref:Variant surface glycoprotein 1772 n=1 Tax=Trypanosoma brucei TaxID=5691 RepID=M4T0Y5_9TRYP|nr:variant surface glycoprotein 1772 [Trypanosoma brucei]